MTTRKFVQEGAAHGLTEEESLQVFREMVDDAEEAATERRDEPLA